MLLKRSLRLISPSDNPYHIALSRVEEDSRISSRIFRPISVHLRVLFATDVVSQGISLPSVGNGLHLVSLPLLSLLSLGLAILYFDFVVSSYALKIFLKAGNALFIRVCVFRGYFDLSFYPFSLLPYRFILFILYCPFSHSPFPLPSGGILKGKLMFPLGLPGLSLLFPGPYVPFLLF